MSARFGLAGTKTFPAPFGAIPGIVLCGPETTKKKHQFLSIFVGGPLGPIHPVGACPCHVAATLHVCIWRHPGQFFPWTGQIKKCFFSLVDQWALFTQCGPLLLSTRGGEIGMFRLARLWPNMCAQMQTSDAHASR